MLPTEVPPYFWTISAMTAFGPRRHDAGAGAGRSQPPEGERRVGAAETEYVRQRGADSHPAGLVRHEVEVAARIAVEKICRRRRDLVAQGEHGGHRLEPPRVAQQSA